MSKSRRNSPAQLAGSIALIASFAACAPTPDDGSVDTATPGDSPSPYLYIWAGDADRAEGDTDFLAAVDADPASPTYGTVLSTAPVGSVGNDPHHAEPMAPGDGLLFANGYDADRTFLFDLSSPAAPTLAGELDPVPGFRYFHSFFRLPDGHVIGTAQTGTEPDEVGGLVEFDARGGLIRTSSAVDPTDEYSMIRPYSYQLFPEQDRLLSSSFAMSLERSDNVLQLWRLSDLSLLGTIEVPELASAESPTCFFEQWVAQEDCAPAQVPGHDRPFEIRELPDGSAVMNTLSCAFFRIHGIDGERPEVDLLLNWEDVVDCGVPSRIGKFYIVPLAISNELVVFDVSDPSTLVEVSRLTLDEPLEPHWTQFDPRADRMIVTGTGPMIHMYLVDPETGELTRDRAFGPDFTMDREDWQHGSTGRAAPHAALFGGQD